MDELRAGTRTIDIGSLVWPCRLIKLTHVALVSFVVTLPVSVLSALLKQDIPQLVTQCGLLALLAFPAYMAWRNIDVVHSIGQRYTIRSLLLCAAVMLLYGLFMLAAASQATEGDERVNLMVTGVVVPAFAIFPLLAAWSVYRLRRKIVDGLGVRLATVVADLAGLERPHRPRQLTPQRPVLGWTLVGLAVAIWLGSDFLPAEYFKTSDQIRIASSLSPYAFLLVLAARAYFQPTAVSLLADDQRPPILLLRSFIDDEKLNWAAGNRSLVDTSLESRLATHFGPFGPFIAVGTPAGGLPVIGAARVHLSDAEWQQHVVRWIGQSRFIIMLAGITDWVEWELRQVISLGAVDKLIVCFPPVGKRKWPDKSLRDYGANMEARLAGLRAAFIDTLWAPALARLADAKTLRGLRFGPEGRVDVVRAKSRDWNTCHLAVLIVQWLMACESSPAASRAPAAPTGTDGERRAWRWPGWLFGGALAAASLALAWSALGTFWGPSLYPIAAGLLLLALAIVPGIPGLGLSWRRWHGPLLLGFTGAAFVLHGALVFGMTWAGEVQSAKADAGTTSNASAMTLFQYPARAGLLEAQFNLALLYLKGPGVAHDEKLACEWMRRPARAGFEGSETVYGMCLLEHVVEPGAGETAADFLQRGAARGNVVAQRSLARLYLDGKLVPRDVPRAIGLLEAASAQGDADAALRLGLLYLGADGQQPQYDKARHQLELADKQGRTEATFRLGLMDLRGIGGPPDLRRAAGYLERATKAGHEGAGVLYALMLYEGLGGLPRDTRRARAMLETARQSRDEKVRKLAEESLKAAVSN